MEDLFDLICKQVSQPLGRRKILSLVYRATGTALLARMGLRSAHGQVACTVDANCPTGTWCNESAGMCTAKLPNGASIPIDSAHTSPPLSGTCTAAVGALVCVSGVCDSDNKCGLANGDGPCTASNGATVCRSGACSVNGFCEQFGGCNVDSDCSGGNWCNESSHTCTAKLANGASIPNDPPHTFPSLNGTCTAAAGTLVCASGVCDASDNKCGFANGDGPCNAANGPSVCRSGICGSSGTCAPSGGCSVAADCPSGQGCCNHICTALGTNTNCASCGNVCSTPFTCVGSATSGTCLQSHSAAVRVTTSGWLFSRVTQQFSGTLTVTNISGSPINAPIVVLLNSLSSGVTLVNASGTFSGAPFIAVLSSGSLAAAGSATVTLQFSDPAKGPITFSPATYTS